jgi:hypothetical protein
LKTNEKFKEQTTINKIRSGHAQHIFIPEDSPPVKCGISDVKLSMHANDRERKNHYVDNNLKNIFTNDPTKDHIVPIQDHRIPLKKSRYRARFNEPLNIENSR